MSTCGLSGASAAGDCVAWGRTATECLHFPFLQSVTEYGQPRPVLNCLPINEHDIGKLQKSDMDRNTVVVR
jgi:hypothetical protein